MSKYWWQSESGQCNTYGHWINTNYPTKESCVNKCNKAVREMTRHNPTPTVGNRTVIKSINGDFHIIRYDDIKEGQEGRYKLLERIGSILRSVGTYHNAKEAKEAANRREECK